MVWDSGSHGQGRREAEVSPLLREANFSSMFLIKEQEKGFILQQMAGPHACFPSEGEIPMVTAGASPSPVFLSIPLLCSHSPSLPL